MIGAVGKEVTVKKVGQTVTNVPRSNVARLMYYLGCVNSCLRVGGTAPIEAKYTNYPGANSLSSTEELNVIVLSVILSPDELIGVCFFVVPDNASCLGGSANEFLEISELTKVVGAAALHGNKIAMFKGEKTQTAKVMVMTKTWLTTYFLDPIISEAPRLEALKNGNTRNACPKGQHCEHFERLKNPHCTECTHPCPYQQSCWSLTDPNHLRHYSHAANLPKCKYAGVCRKLKDHDHRASFHHPGMRDYMIKCRYGTGCREQDDLVHTHKYYHH